MSTKKLTLLSQNLPYLPGEQFLETELEYLSSYFSDIDLLPVAYQKDNKKRAVPENVHVFPMDRKLTPSKALTYVRRFITVLSDYQGLEWCKEDWIKARKHGIGGILKLINWVGMSVNIRKQLELKYKFTGKDKNRVFYSYWLNPSAIALAMLAEKYEGVVCVSRAHGGDLYAYRHTPAYLPLQKKTINHLTKVFLISTDGKEYLMKEHTSIEPDSLVVSRLGTISAGHQPDTSETNEIHLVTCSYMVPVKRIDLLVKALQNIEGFNLRWTHIGDGPLKEELSDLASKLPSNVEWNFTGSLTNQEVMSFYKKNHIDLFINVSESEGVPVSIMEAFSFGIPVIATNVGGTAELVNDLNGKLLNKDIDPYEITNAIEEFASKSNEEKRRKSEMAYRMWEEHFNAEKNYKQFAEQLLHLEDREKYEVSK